MSIFDFYDKYKVLPKFTIDVIKKELDKLRLPEYIAKQVSEGSKLHTIQFSEFDKWGVANYVDTKIPMYSETLQMWLARMESYSYKGNFDAVIETNRRILRGGRAKLPKKYTREYSNDRYRSNYTEYAEEYLGAKFDDDMDKMVGIHNLPKYDFFNQGRGYVLSDGDKKIIENIFTKVQI